ncbi:MAG: RcnB family protein [Caulobacterales bacterium]
MRRLISLLAAVALVAAPLATAGAAMADPHGDHRGHGEGQGGGDRGDRGRGGRGDGGGWNGGGRGAPSPQAYRGGGESRGGGGGRYERGDPGAEYGYERRMDPRYDPRAYAPPPNAYRAAPRRGGYLGPGSGGTVIQDYSRFRLRPPPRGYEWVRTPSGMAMVSTMTGQVFDVVPY